MAKLPKIPGIPAFALLALSAALPARAEHVTPDNFVCRSFSAKASQDLSQRSMGWSQDTQKATQTDGAFSSALSTYISSPRYFPSEGGSCGTSGRKKTGTCQQLAECAAIPGKMRDQIIHNYKQLNGTADPQVAALSKGWHPKGFAFKDVPTDFKLASVQNQAGLQWMVSSVSCAAPEQQPGASPVCPPPDQCKGDLSSGGSLASIDPNSWLTHLNGEVMPDGTAGGSTGTGYPTSSTAK